MASSGILETIRHIEIYEKIKFHKIILFVEGIETDDRGRIDAARCLRGPGRLPDWKPPNHLNILKGVEK